VLAGAGLPLAAFGLPATAAADDDIQVSNTLNSGAGSLREAISTANGDADADTIHFQSGVTGTITLIEAESGELSISNPVKIYGPGAGVLAISGDGDDQIFQIDMATAGDDVLISGLTLTDGAAEMEGGLDEGYGGAINNLDADLTISGSVIQNSEVEGNGDDGGGSGGGIHSTGGLTITGSTLRGNSAEYPGGGAAISSESADLRVSNSTIADNRAPGVGAAGILARFGGDLVEITGTTISGNVAKSSTAVALEERSAVIRNTTIANNRAENGYESSSAGVFQYGGTLAIENTTIAANTATEGGPTVSVANATMTLRNSIVAGGSASGGADLRSGGTGTFILGSSLVQNVGSASFVNVGDALIGPDPQLLGLANNGGPTLTMRPAPGSPAVDKGRDSIGLATDQRGGPRHVDNPFAVNNVIAGALGTDIGAVELSLAEGPQAPPRQFNLKAALKKCKKKRSKKARKKCKKKARKKAKA
jgi:hypothetical protein